jgi:hypothetical protein
MKISYPIMLAELFKKYASLESAAVYADGIGSP